MDQEMKDALKDVLDIMRKDSHMRGRCSNGFREIKMEERIDDLCRKYGL